MVRGDSYAFSTWLDSVFNTNIFSHQEKLKLFSPSVVFEDIGNMQNMWSDLSKFIKAVSFHDSYHNCAHLVLLRARWKQLYCTYYKVTEREDERSPISNTFHPLSLSYKGLTKEMVQLPIVLSSLPVSSLPWALPMGSEISGTQIIPKQISPAAASCPQE